MNKLTINQLLDKILSLKCANEYSDNLKEKLLDVKIELGGNTKVENSNEIIIKLNSPFFGDSIDIATKGL